LDVGHFGDKVTRCLEKELEDTADSETFGGITDDPNWHCFIHKDHWITSSSELMNRMLLDLWDLVRQTRIHSSWKLSPLSSMVRTK
jgi:hypothetical protein